MKAMTLATLLLCVPAMARDNDGLPGSAIAIEFSISPSVLRASETAEVMACLTNQNPRSARSISTGDTFDFVFPTGTVAASSSPFVHSPSGLLVAGSFAASMTSGVLEVRYQGSGARWAPGDSVCTQLALVAPASPITVPTRQHVANQGAFSHPSPAAILLAIGTGLGTVGPPGPPGPVGPAGPPGESGVGARVFARSSDLAYAIDNEPPEPVPGLDVTITTTRATSDLLVLAHLPMTSNEECNSRTFAASDTEPTVLLEIDGIEVARRWAAPTSAFSWRASGVSAGTHRVRLLVASNITDPLRHEPTFCVGSGTDTRHEGHLIVLDLP